MTETIVIVTGMREWRDKETIYRALEEEMLAHIVRDPPFRDPRVPHNELLHAVREREHRKRFIIRHGVGGNADGFANEWGIERGVTIERFPAKWHDNAGQYNPAAGPIRNKQMATALPRAHRCLAFWDGSMRKAGSREFSGTLDMIKIALANSIPVRVEPPSK